MEKLRKLGKGLYTFARIVFVFARIGAVVSFVAAVAALFIDGSLDLDGTEKIMLGTLNIELSADYVGALSSVKASIAAVLCIAGAECVFIAILAKLSEGILTPIKDGTPFAGGISSSIKKLSFAVLIGGGILQILNVAAEYALISMVDWGTLFNAESVTGITMGYEVDLMFVAEFVIIYTLSLVFRYGEELQRQSDETL